MKRILEIAQAIEGYDPDALHVDKARAAIHACLSPVKEVERVPVRESLGRVLAEDIVPAIDVPGHDNTAMDGYALRFADLGSHMTCSGSAVKTTIWGVFINEAKGATRIALVLPCSR